MSFLFCFIFPRNAYSFLFFYSLTFGLDICQKAVADIERAIAEALDKQYADVLSPLKDNLMAKVFGLKYVQKIAKRTVNVYFVPDEVNFYSYLCSFCRISFYISQIELKFLSFSFLFSARNSFKFHEKDVGRAVAQNRKPV